MSENEERQAAIAEAKTWLGTPYHHMGRVRGYRGGVDCGQYLIAVFAAVGKIKDFEPVPYTKQFALHNTREQYLEYMRSNAHEIPMNEAKPGDVVLYKVGRCFSHGAILVDPWPGNVIHAVNSLGVVISHGTREGFIGRFKDRKFFTCWPK